MIISSLFLVLAAITLIASEEITSTVSTSDNGAEPKANLKCIACLNCKIFEVTSHSMDCEATATRCMVTLIVIKAKHNVFFTAILPFQKNGLRSGEIERSCATEATCEEGNNDFLIGRRVRF
jgi:hypothetical protein